MRGRGKSCAARPREQGRHAVSKVRRAISMKIEVKESKRGNIAVMRKRLMTVSQGRGVDQTKSFIPPCSIKLYEWSLTKHVEHTLYEAPRARVT